MRFEPKYKSGERVLYNSLLSAGAAHGTILSVDNETEPHTYSVEPDQFKGKTDKVKEFDIYNVL